jgi:beta-1,4-mannosyltransferase
VDGPATPLRVIAWHAWKHWASNPHNWLLYTHLVERGCRVDEFSPGRLLRGPYDVWHLHWPAHALLFPLPPAVARGTALLALMDLARARGTTVVWTIHNLRSHLPRHPRLDAWLHEGVVRRLDGYISLSEAARAEALAKWPRLARLPGYVIPHGHYREAYPHRFPRDEARRRLGIAAGAGVIAFVGVIQPYKNVAALVRAFVEARIPDGVLLVAGNPSSAALRDEITRAAAGHSGVRLDWGHVPDERLGLYLGAADLVVLPFAEILNSGSAILALSFDRPVLVPALGSMGELRDLVGAEWVRTFTGGVSAEILRQALAWARERPRGRAPLDALDWDRIAARTEEAYRGIRGGAGGQRLRAEQA